ncbi:hypothetical protein AKJ58_01405 [candidate division MSBL1 archaeon SCGC-AAA385D11]|uniref:Uncharacterized protein n=1 Tax=candidate division MSBL1 archaeon SCGC-AAA385D11 TaxID=1698286 RepID=A0A133VND2_9EURY|nr:hypothetical protein AKJ58_01405 [candidate division MSBL1 archaeon SCGC-AAA385D11]
MAKDRQILIRVSPEQKKEYEEFAKEFTEGNMARMFRRCAKIVMKLERNQNDQQQELSPFKSSLDAIFELCETMDRKLSVLSMTRDSGEIDSSVLEVARNILDQMGEMDNPTYSQIFGNTDVEQDVFEGAVFLIESLGWEVRRDDPNDYEGGGENCD